MLIVISLDGFRWDYLQRNLSLAPNLARLFNTGISAKYMVPCFPSKTFPNHYSIVTGLYPESHGIIANTIWDPTIGYTFTLYNQGPKDARWWLGEPIWVTAQKAGLKSGIYFWPGSEAPIQGMYPTYYAAYEGSVTPSQRVEGLFGYLDEDPDIRFMAIYFENVDSIGHDYGPSPSPQLNSAIQTVDEAIGMIITNLEKRDLWDSTNLFVVGDHGMTQMSPDKVVFIDKCINMSDVYIVDWSPILALIPNDLNNTQNIYDQLSQCDTNLQVYLKEDIPERFHYQISPRITPIVGIATPQWSITTAARFSPGYYTGGTHGYDNEFIDMETIFFARGPDLKSGGTVIDSFQNIHIYNLFVHLLGLTNGAPNNGTDYLINQVVN
eukprot:TRINITY_DN1504_c0_g1_i2.p1 TRINITY_DN1504_c0_g1~~TRINITY_DN1504_c0_g1_i2.p1  ORF type:complete len:381 (+),score=38.69 TRINITY_DN1504_c0_g1_i2:203-1345(+)